MINWKMNQTVSQASYFHGCQCSLWSRCWINAQWLCSTSHSVTRRPQTKRLKIRRYELNEGWNWLRIYIYIYIYMIYIYMVYIYIYICRGMESGIRFIRVSFDELKILGSCDVLTSTVFQLTCFSQTETWNLMISFFSCELKVKCL